MRKVEVVYSVWWNMMLISVGSILFALGAQAIAIPHQFLPGGLFGLASLLYYGTGWLDAGTWYFLFNLPVFIFAWFKVSRRFCLYSFYAMAVTSVAFTVLSVEMPIGNELYAAVAAGAICGAGVGVVLRSLGSNGGLDVLAVWLSQKYNLGIGRTYFLFNLVLFATAVPQLGYDRIIASMIMVFISAVTMDYVLALFSQRKLVLIVSEAPQRLAKAIMSEMKHGATFLSGYGAYTNAPKDVLLTVVNNVQLKRLEELTFTNDPNALFIVENTFTVLGSSFSKRKIY
jgi:uncharacterized membrane-anchored protein YitT (DUF2179 family)